MPPSLPTGAKFEVLQGDPSQPGIYTVRLELPDGYYIPPHYHPADEALTVISGTFLIGLGDQMNRSAMHAIGPSGFMVNPARVHHYAQARGKTVIQVSGMGPFVITYVNPADDPRNKRPAS